MASFHTFFANRRQVSTDKSMGTLSNGRDLCTSEDVTHISELTGKNLKVNKNTLNIHGSIMPNADLTLVCQRGPPESSLRLKSCQ